MIFFTNPEHIFCSCMNNIFFSFFFSFKPFLSCFILLFQIKTDIPHLPLVIYKKFQLWNTAANSNLEILQIYRSNVLRIMLPGTSQMTHSILILRYQPSKKLSTNSVKDIATTKEVSEQSRSQSDESKRSSEKTQEREIYRSIKLIFHS